MKFSLGSVRALARLERPGKQEYIALSQKYHQGDEKRLPYPELSTRGRALHKMFELLQKSKVGVVIAPKFADPVLYLLRTQKSHVFTADANEVAACIETAPHESVFDYWRVNRPRTSLKLPEPVVTFWVNPDLESLFKYSDSVAGAYIGDGIEDHPSVKALAAIGLTSAKPVGSGFWLTR